jgi:hypothetical protein
MMYGTRYTQVKEFAIVPLIAIGVGLLGDLALMNWRPSALRVRALRAFSFGLPFGFFMAYYVGLLATNRLGITPHMWLGTSIMAGIAGLFMSYVFAPPAIGDR